MEEVLSRQIALPSAVLFLGDGLRDLEGLAAQYEHTPVYAVAGNCDASTVFSFDEPLTRVLHFDGRTVVMMHGHTFGVRYGLDDAVRFAAEQQADVLLFGHTHLPYERVLPVGHTVDATVSRPALTLSKPLLLANPGSIGLPRDGGPRRFGVLTLRQQGVLFSHGSLT